MKKLLASILFMSLIGLCFANINEIFVNYDLYSKPRVNQAQDISEDINTIFIGGSRILRALSPLKVWNETGLRGINLSSVSQPPIITKNLLEDYIGKLKIDYVILDPSGIQSNASPAKSKVIRHKNGIELLTSYRSKYNAISEVEEYYPNIDLTQYLIPFQRDHSRWKDLKKHDFDRSNRYDHLKLGNLNLVYKEHINLAERDWRFSSEDHNEIVFDEISMHIYSEIIEELKSRNITVFIVNLPAIDGYTKSPVYKKLASDHNVEYIDLATEVAFKEIGLEDEDFYDWMHLSTPGAYKTSEYLGKIFAEEFGLSFDKDNETYQKLYEEFENQE